MKLQQKFKAVEPHNVNYLEGLVEVSDEFAIDFAKWCVITQAFGLYGYEKALEIYKQENNL